MRNGSVANFLGNMCWRLLLDIAEHLLSHCMQQVDIDVSLEGDARKVSRRAASIVLHADGAFSLRCLGRRSVSVSPRPCRWLASGKAELQTISLRMFDIRCMLCAGPCERPGHSSRQLCAAATSEPPRSWTRAAAVCCEPRRCAPHRAPLTCHHPRGMMLTIAAARQHVYGQAPQSIDIVQMPCRCLAVVTGHRAPIIVVRLCLLLAAIETAC